MADKITRTSVGPTKSSTEKADALDAQVPNPDWWCIAGTIEHTLSSQLYPVAVVDAMVFGISIVGGAMGLTPRSDVETSFGFEDMSYTQVRWFYSDGPYFSDVESAFGFEDMVYTQVRWFYSDGPYFSDVESGFGFVDIVAIAKLVVGDTPDEGLQMTITINNTCTMDLI